MVFQDLIAEIFEICLLPLLGVLTAYFVKWIKSKSEQLMVNTDNVLYKKYIDMLNATITDCVSATTQTYVDTLKKQGKFDAEAQEAAFNKTYAAVMDTLSEEALSYLNEIVSDMEVYITQKIEATVLKNKS